MTEDLEKVIDWIEKEKDKVLSDQISAKKAGFLGTAKYLEGKTNALSEIITMIPNILCSEKTEA